MRKTARMFGNLLLLSVFGFMLPFAWPRHHIHLLNLLAFLGGVFLVTFTGTWGYRIFGVTGAISGVVTGNMCAVFAWVTAVLIATTWMSPPKDDPSN